MTYDDMQDKIEVGGGGGTKLSNQELVNQVINTQMQQM